MPHTMVAIRTAAARGLDPSRASRPLRLGAVLLALLAFPTVDGRSQAAGPPAAPPHSLPRPRTRVPHRATGTFEVKVTPQAADAYADGAALGRMTLDKEFRGDLQATGKGQMLTGMTDVKGSAGYVAIERVSGTLHGRRGSFVLQHSGTMTRGAASLTITVVPDSGTDELAGLRGTMTIDVSAGHHAYTFDYTLPGVP